MSGHNIDVPHSLGAAEAKRRIEAGTGQLLGALPAGATATPSWTGDRLDLAIAAMGQEMSASLDVQETVVRVTVTLPPMLEFLRPLIEQGIRRSGTQLLEHKS